MADLDAWFEPEVMERVRPAPGLFQFEGPERYVEGSTAFGRSMTLEEQARYVLDRTRGLGVVVKKKPRWQPGTMPMGGSTW